MRPFFCLLALLLSSSAAFATHFVGGHIRVTPVANSGLGLSYRISVITYYDMEKGSGAATAAVNLAICFGDGQPTTILQRTAIRPLAGDPTISINTYEIIYTYAGPGTYLIQVTGTNRTMARNTGDVDQPFAIRTTVQASSAFRNQTPVLSLPATGLKVALNQRITLSLAADADPEGDSLSYALTNPLTSATVQSNRGGPCDVLSSLIPYQFPNDVRQTGTYRINAQTGLLSWDVPVDVGQYAVAITVSEWRFGVLISQTQHELVLTVVDRGGTPVTPPAYVPAQQGLITAISDADPVGLALSVSPNPVVTGSVEVILTSRETQPATLQLLDSQGRVRQSVLSGTSAQRHQHRFDMSNQPAGLYLIRAESGGQQVVRKVLKQ